MAIVFIIMLAALATSIILAVMFGPDEKLDDEIKNVRGEPLAIMSTPAPEPKPREVSYIGVWDDVDQHWGEAQWMMATG